MAGRDECSRFPLGELEAGERFVGFLHFREGVECAEVVRLWDEVAVLVSRRFGDKVLTEEARVCREFDVGRSAPIYRPSAVSRFLDNPAAGGL